MRRVIAWELVSLVGVMERPEAWAFSQSDDEMGEASVAGMAASDALLLGRVGRSRRPGANPLAVDHRGFRADRKMDGTRPRH